MLSAQVTSNQITSKQTYNGCQDVTQVQSLVTIHIEPTAMYLMSLSLKLVYPKPVLNDVQLSHDIIVWWCSIEPCLLHLI